MIGQLAEVSLVVVSLPLDLLSVMAERVSSRVAILYEITNTTALQYTKLRQEENYKYNEGEKR